jgi:pimeloyl-ACP methyl ester carboxylesterase
VADAWGPPDGRLVVLLHGGGQTRSSWGDTAERLGDAGYHALTVDQRGHGDSPWDDQARYELTDFGRDVTALCWALPRPPVLVGASLGGLSSLLTLGIAEPPPVAGLVMVDVAATLRPDGVKRVIAFMHAYPDGFATLEDAADAIAAYLPHRTRPADTSGLSRVLRLRDDGRWGWHWDPRFLSERPMGSHESRTERIKDLLTSSARAVRCPTLLVRGKLSDVIGDQDVALFRELVPHCQLVDVRDAGHMIAGDKNDRFTEAVVAFLEGL